MGSAARAIGLQPHIYSEKHWVESSTGLIIPRSTMPTSAIADPRRRPRLLDAREWGNAFATLISMVVAVLALVFGFYSYQQQQMAEDARRQLEQANLRQTARLIQVQTQVAQLQAATTKTSIGRIKVPLR